jgi:hypothetical protein
MVRGAGASTCGDYARIYDAYRSMDSARDSAVSRQATVNFLQYEEWIDGFILGMETSLRGASTPRDWDKVDLSKWVSDYCQNHRSEIVANAALALFKGMVNGKSSDDACHESHSGDMSIGQSRMARGAERLLTRNA